MAELFKKLKCIKKNKLLIIVGVIGILLISFSSVFPSESEKSTVCEEKFDTEEYRQNLERDIKKIVKGITGSRNVTVLLTIENGVKYYYADETSTNDSRKTGQNSDDKSSSKEQKYIILSNSDGDEKPLLITEELPEIRGVAVVFDGPANEELYDLLKNALSSALNITSKRIFITSKGGN